jgi:hypothetical protein
MEGALLSGKSVLSNCAWPGAGYLYFRFRCVSDPDLYIYIYGLYTLEEPTREDLNLPLCNIMDSGDLPALSIIVLSWSLVLHHSHTVCSPGTSTRPERTYSYRACISVSSSRARMRDYKDGA